MQLKRARVTKYRSIEDSGWVDFRDVVALVGKNESGKTTFLHALERLNPENEEHANFDMVRDYPRRDLAKYKKVHETNPATVVEAVFELQDGEMLELEAAFGKGAIKGREVVATKGYDNQRRWTVPLDEGAIVRHVAASCDLPTDVLKLVKRASHLDAFVEELGALPDKAPSVEKFIQEVEKRFPKGTTSTVINGYLVRYIPRFVYFDDYSIMRGTINLQDMGRRLKANPPSVDSSDQTFLALLALADSSIDDFIDNSDYEARKAQLEAVSTSITDDVFKYWRQNKQLQVEFDIAAGTAAEKAPFNTGTNLHVRIRNDRHRVTVPFDERSRGFVWFFSFFAYFSRLEASSNNLILLLDEPGLNLHAKAQEDFLMFIDERLAPTYQVIYTTHSNFMIAPDKLERVRTVQDVDGKGTTVSSDIMRTDKDTLFPLQAALGYSLAQTLFSGVNNLIVEGPADLLYLRLLGQRVKTEGLSPLDAKWAIAPVGGVDKIHTFVTLLGSNGLNMVVLMDVAANDKQRIDNLQANALLGQSALVRVTEVTGTKAADLEDIFEPDFYLKLVNGAYEDLLDRPITLADMPSGNPRIVKRLEVYFQENGIDGGVFNHLAPAEYFLLNQAALLPLLDSKTIERATRLFDRVNSLLGARVQPEERLSARAKQTTAERRKATAAVPSGI